MRLTYPTSVLGLGVGRGDRRRNRDSGREAPPAPPRDPAGHAHCTTVAFVPGTISPAAIRRAPTLKLQRWDNARAHDTELSSDALDGSEDVFALGKTIAAALARPHGVPAAFTELLGRMLAADPDLRPTAPAVVTAARAVRDAIGFVDAVDDDGPEIVIEYAKPAVEDELILLERRRVPLETVIVDLDAY